MRPTPPVVLASGCCQVMRHAAVRCRRLQAVLPWVVALTALIFLKAVCRAFHISQFVLPPFSAVAASMLKWWPAVLGNAAQTPTTTRAGFGVTVAGLLMSVALGSGSMVYRGLYRLMVAFESVPKVAIVPILILSLGIGPLPAIQSSFLNACFFIAVSMSMVIPTPFCRRGVSLDFKSTPLYRPPTETRP